jgi:predicted transcriptional regulator
MDLTSRGEFPDMNELLEAVPYECSKQALQFSIRYLEKHGMLERRDTELRRGRKRRVVAPTPHCYAVMRPGSGM